MSEGEFHFTLTERRDRNLQLYLFAGIRFLNSVLFIRPEPTEPGQPQRWQAILKPYRPKGEQDNYDDPWNQPPTNNNTNDNEGERDDERNQSTKPQRRPR